ncbi:MAG TPA: hypothetical protein VF285_03140 [Castellaniella sp.]|uniref:hypothetical protein n=1 Tax=Castellaniella sp. TaxID=1955812 RepID=UPI002F100A60
MKKRLVGVNESGYRVGEDHHGARLTNHEVDMLRVLHEDEGMSYTVLAEKFDVSKSCVADICRYRRRGQVSIKFKMIGWVS